MNYSSLAFSDATKKLQEKFGSRANYARMEKQSYVEGLTENEIEFISLRDEFYMSTMGENGYPYIQFRGGPAGFLKVLDDKRIGFIDFRGNMQYITAGNLATNNKAALFLMDYPGQTRLKIYAEAQIVELKDDQALFSRLNLTDYKFKPERMMVFTIKAYSWNCPQHITPRYTLKEVEEIFESQQLHIASLEAELKTLKAKNAK